MSTDKNPIYPHDWKPQSGLGVMVSNCKEMHSCDCVCELSHALKAEREAREAAQRRIGELDRTILDEYKRKVALKAAIEKAEADATTLRSQWNAVKEMIFVLEAENSRFKAALERISIIKQAPENWQRNIAIEALKGVGK